MSKNILKKAISLTGVAAASLFLSFPALAAVNSNVNNFHQESNQFLAQNTSDIDPNVNSTERNTAPQVNREQNRPGTGSDSDTQQNYTNESDSEPNRMMQNQTGNQNRNSPNNTNNTNNNNRIMQNRTGSQNQNSPNGTNNPNNNGSRNPSGGSRLNNSGTSDYNNGTSNDNGGSRMDNSGSSTNNSDTGAIRGMW